MIVRAEVEAQVAALQRPGAAAGSGGGGVLQEDGSSGADAAAKAEARQHAMSYILPSHKHHGILKDDQQTACIRRCSSRLAGHERDAYGLLADVADSKGMFVCRWLRCCQQSCRTCLLLRPS